MPVKGKSRAVLKTGPVELEAGQVWEFPSGRIVIVRIGKILGHYKRPVAGRRNATVKMESLANIKNFLLKTGAILLPVKDGVKG